MKIAVDKEEIKLIDNNSINRIGIPALVLMERAALEMAKKIKKYIDFNQKLLILVEGGNNGGDGIALGRILFEMGYEVDIFYINSLERKTKEFEQQYSMAEKSGMFITDRIKEKTDTDFINKIINNNCNIIVDGIFGVGLSRNIEGIHRNIIDEINKLQGIKVAIDIPSGIDSSSGDVLGTAFIADYTYTFGFIKVGMLFEFGMNYSGNIKVIDIGFPKRVVSEINNKYFYYEKKDLCGLPIRRNNSNKGTYGKILVIAGMENMCGAAYFAGAGAYKSGAGLVKILTHETNRTALQTLLPEAILETYNNESNIEDKVINSINWADVIIIGPGLGMNFMAHKLVKIVVTKAKVPVVVDADGINCISQNTEIIKNTKTKLIFTPHMKEMSRLVGKDVEYIKENRFLVAKSFSKEYNVTCVLKDYKSIVAENNRCTYINISGNNGMSTGGTGDVLTGIIGAFIAGGIDVFQASCLGCYVHGLAGDEAAKEMGQFSIVARDIINNIYKVIGQ